jgi:hypothetical protein
MGKVIRGAAPQTVTKEKPATKKQNLQAVYMSDEDAGQQEIIIVYGEMGSGKTFAAATASNYAPKEFPAKSKTILKDMFWIQCDAKATAGFAHNNISVATFDVFRFMSNEALWAAYDIKKEPTIVDATKWAIASAKEFINNNSKERVKIVIDTLSAYDTASITHFDAVCKNHPNAYEAYKLNLGNHRVFHEALRRLDADIIYLCHSRAFTDDSTSDKNKAVRTKVAGGGSYAPDLTGAAPGIYKRDASLQLVCKAFKEKVKGKSTIKRKLLIGLNDLNYEAKNRYEGILPDEQEPVNINALYTLLRKQ